MAAGKVSLLHGRSLSNHTRGEDTRESSDVQIQSQQAVETSITAPHTHASLAYRENQRLASNLGSSTSSRNLTSLANDTMRRRSEIAPQARPVLADQTSNAERMDADGGLEQEGLTQERVQCNGCGRSFAPAAFSKHTKICAKVINYGLLLTLFPFSQPNLLYIAHLSRCETLWLFLADQTPVYILEIMNKALWWERPYPVHCELGSLLHESDLVHWSEIFKWTAT